MSPAHQKETHDLGAVLYLSLDCLVNAVRFCSLEIVCDQWWFKITVSFDFLMLTCDLNDLIFMDH